MFTVQSHLRHDKPVSNKIQLRVDDPFQHDKDGVISHVDVESVNYLVRLITFLA